MNNTNTSTPDAPPLTILNVNDDDAARYIVTRILQRVGYEVVEAATGTEALRFVQENPDRADLVVLDVNLPDINGIEVCKQIKADLETAALPVLHLSATSVGTEDQAQGLESGADGYLTQPVEPLVLAATVKALLRLSLSESRSRSAAQTWETVFASIGDAVCILDSDGRISRCNPAMAKITGIRVSGIEGEIWADLIGRAFPGADFPAEQTTDVGQHLIYEVKTGRTEGAAQWLRLTIELLAPDKTDKRRTVGSGTVRTLVDITESKAAVLRQRSLLRDILADVTDGRLQVCLLAENLPERLPPAAGPVTLSAPTIRALRIVTQQAALAIGFEAESVQDLETAVGEAAMNAVVHAGKGVGQVCSDGKDHIQVWIEDNGSGIAFENLHLATLQRGYSTTNTLGHGFWLILKTCDRVWLLTGDTGTTIVLEYERKMPRPYWGSQS